MDSKTLNISWPEHQKNVLGLFNQLYQTSKLVDVTLTCLEGSIKAHKIILSTCSPFFQRIIEENPCKHPIIILRGSTFKDIKRILDFMYTGSIRAKENEIQSLLQTAEDLDITGLKHCIATRFNTIISIDKKRNKRCSDTFLNESIPKKINKASQESVTLINKDNSTIQNINASAESKAPTHGRETRFKGKKRVEVHHDRVRLPKMSICKSKSTTITAKNNLERNIYSKIKGKFLLD